MTKNEIVKKLYTNQIVKQIIRNIAHGREKPEDLIDLEQDIFLILLEKPEEFLQGLYERGEINFWLANIIYTQIRSSTSPFYKNYKKFSYLSNELEDAKNVKIENERF